MSVTLFVFKSDKSIFFNVLQLQNILLILVAIFVTKIFDISMLFNELQS